MAKISTLVENFATSYTTHFEESFASEVAVEGGRLNLALFANTGQFVYINVGTKTTWDASNDSLFLKWTPNTPGSPGEYQGIQLRMPDAQNYAVFSLYGDESVLQMRVFQNGAENAGTVNLLYNPTTMAWVRFRLVGQVVHFDTSPDAVTWTTRHSATHTISTASQQSSAIFFSHGTDSATNTTKRNMYVDNINTVVAGAANAGADQTVASNSVVTLVGTPAGGIWTQESGDTVSLSSPVTTATDTKTTFVSSNVSTTTSNTRVFRYTVDDTMLYYETFGTSIGAWQNSGNVVTSVVSYSTDVGYNGAAGSLKIVSVADPAFDQTKAEALNKRISVVNGGTYRVRAWVRSLNATRSISFPGGVEDAGGTFIGFTGPGEQSIPANTWTLYDKTFTINNIPNAAKFAVSSIFVNLTRAGGETFYIADYRVDRV